MPLMPFLKASAGIHAKVDPVRLRYDPETGVQLLAQAVNVDVDQAGRISRRKGKRKIIDATAPHSLWSTNDEAKAFFIAGDTLYSFLVDGTTQVIKAGLTVGLPGFFCKVGQDVFFNNGSERGIVRNGETWEDWEATPYTGVDTVRRFSGPPQGTIITHYRGRILIASNNDKAIWYSEPLNYGCFDLARNFFLTGGNILMMIAGDEGIFYSSETAVFYLRGQSYKEIELVKILDVPAVPGTAITLRSEWISPEFQGEAVCFVAQDMGVCVVLNNGTVLTLSKDRVDLPHASTGCAVIDRHHDFKYLAFMEI